MHVTEPDDDAGLARDFAAGDDDALARCYARWSPLLYTLAMRSLGNVSDAEDVVQKVFVAAWRGRATYDSSRPLGGWLVGITRNAIADAHASRSKLKAIHERLATAAPALVVDDDSALIDRLTVADEIGRLEPDAQRVIRLAFFEGMSHSQISQQVGLPLGTVKSHIRRSLDRMRARLEAHRGPY